MKSHCTLFVLCSQYVLFRNFLLACFDPSWPVLKIAVADFESGLFRTGSCVRRRTVEAIPNCARERAVSEKQPTGSPLDSPVVPWLLVAAMLATGFLAACFIVLR